MTDGEGATTAPAVPVMVVPEFADIEVAAGGSVVFSPPPQLT
jgi:hypothetical protein